MPANLPPELWRIILRNVVHIRGALETVMTTQFEWLEWQYDESERHAESIANRLSLIRVCKAWYSPALELLYEDIRLRSLEKINILRISLDESSGIHLGRGWWTKRLDISPQEEITDSFLVPFIDHFPNLHILHFKISDAIPYQFKNALPKLRYTHLEPSDGRHPPTDLDSLLLLLSVCYTYTFSNLTALEILFNRDDPSALQNSSFPNLRHLTLSSTIEGDLPTLSAFLDRYGQQLLSLRIASDSNELCPHIEQLLSKTPNLREFIVRPNFRVLHKDNIFPSVTHIGIVGFLPSMIDAFMDPFFNLSRFPNLKCIRMIDNVFLNMGFPATKKPCYQNNKLVGVSYEDAQGRVLSEHYSFFLRELIWEGGKCY